MSTLEKTMIAPYELDAALLGSVILCIHAKMSNCLCKAIESTLPVLSVTWNGAIGKGVTLTIIKP